MTLRIFSFIGLLFLTLSPSFSFGAGIDGSQRYTPTALEWLYLYCHTISETKTGYFATCDMEKPNTIKIRIGYWDKELKKEAEDQYLPMSFLLKDYAKAKGWDWLKITKEVSFISNGKK